MCRRWGNACFRVQPYRFEVFTEYIGCASHCAVVTERRHIQPPQPRFVYGHNCQQFEENSSPLPQETYARPSLASRNDIGVGGVFIPKILAMSAALSATSFVSVGACISSYTLNAARVARRPTEFGPCGSPEMRPYARILGIVSKKIRHVRCVLQSCGVTHEPILELLWDIIDSVHAVAVGFFAVQAPSGVLFQFLVCFQDRYCVAAAVGMPPRELEVLGVAPHPFVTSLPVGVLSSSQMSYSGIPFTIATRRLLLRAASSLKTTVRQIEIWPTL